MIQLDLPQRTAPRPTRTAPATSRRNYSAAEISRLTADIFAPLLSANRALESGIRSIRGRAQWLERNDPLVRKLRRILIKNVVGPYGFTLQVSLGERAKNQEIEEAWWAYANSKHVHAGRQFNLQQLLAMAVVRRKLDGEVFLVQTQRADNPYRVCWQLYEADQCPLELNRQKTQSAAEIRYGIERDEHGAPIAYHFIERHASEGATRTRRIPADDVIHAAHFDRPGQVRGVPEIAAAILLLAHLVGYREAELVAARQGANSPIILKPDKDTFQPTARTAEEVQLPDAAESVPGDWLVSPTGFEPWVPDLKHPNSGFASFTKDITRAIAASWDVSYHTLAADLEGANMSSARIGELADRDGWIAQQEEAITDMVVPMFGAWSSYALLTGHLKLRPTELDRLLLKSSWQGRRWKGVDPKKDMEGLALELANCIQSRTNACAEAGRDFSEIMHQVKAERDLAEQLGITLPDASQLAVAIAKGGNSKDDEDTDEDEDEDKPARRLRAVS